MLGVGGGQRRRLLLLLASALVLSACTGTSDARPSSNASKRAATAAESRATACRAAARSVVEVTRRYVAGYADLGLTSTPDRGTSPSPNPSETAGVTDDDLQAAIDRAQRVRRQQRCDAATFEAELQQGLAALTAEGPVAAAVLQQLRANLTGRAGSTPTTRAVTPADDLGVVLTELATGSTLTLGAGTYRLDDALVLLRGVTLRGASTGDTVITSGAPDAALLVLTGERVVVEDLTVRRTGRRAGSVILGGSAASLQLTGVRLEGARLGRNGGGAGVIMTAAKDETTTGGTTLEVTDSSLVDNEGAGIALTGGHRASVVSSDFRGNGQCGVCFLGASGGAVRRSTFTGNGSGVAVAGTADPVVQGNDVRGGRVGMQATGDAAPVLSGNVITGAARAAVIFDEDAAGRVSRTRCQDVPYGIVVGGAAHPLLESNACRLARGR